MTQRSDASAPDGGPRCAGGGRDTFGATLTRFRLLLMISTGCWTFFFLQHYLGELPRSAANDAFALLGTLLTGLTAWNTRSQKRLRRTTHACIAFSCGGMVGATLLTGQAASPEIYYLACIPAAAAWVLDVRGGAAWTAIAIGTMTFLQYSGLWFTVEPEYLVEGGELVLSRALLLTALFLFGYASLRASARQMAQIEDRERTIERQARDLAVARDEALRASTAKGEFLASMSHEIRTPLNAVIGYAQLMLDTELSDEQRGMMETVKSGGDTLLSLLNDILDFSKIEAGKVELELQPMSLRTCIAGTVDLLGPRARDKGLALRSRVADEVPETILADVTRLRQILFNLVANAIKFTPKGEVAVCATATPLDSGRLEIRIDVSDTGIGIVKESLDRLFLSFSQANASTARRFGGTGLGLAISKRLAELMGGRMWVESVPDVGSTFSFTFRAEVLSAAKPDPERAAAKPALDRGLASRNPLRILVAEDNVVNQKLVLRLLARMGYEADLAANGLEVLEAVAKQPYDVILMDMQMPELDGVEATRRLRLQYGAGRGPRIVALTANAMHEHRAECLEAGMDDFVAKPIVAAQLAAALERCG